MFNTESNQTKPGSYAYSYCRIRRSYYRLCSLDFLESEQMRRLGRGLDSLIHAVDDPVKESTSYPRHPGSDPSDPTSSLSTPLPWPVEHPNALTPTPLRLSARSHLDKLSTRPRSGLKAAHAYLDKLRQEDGRTHVSLDLSHIDLTSCTMIQLTRGRVVNQVRHSFLGVLSIWK